MKYSLLTTAALVTVAGLASAEAKKMPAKSQDEVFAMSLASGNMFEIESSKVALKTSSDPAIKAFAQKMVDDHMKAGEEFKALLGQKGMMAPEKLNPVHAAIVEMLKECSPANFDDAYKCKQYVSHVETVLVLESEIKKGSDPQMKAFATKLLPTVQMHLDMVGKMLGKAPMMMPAGAVMPPAAAPIIR